MIMEDSRMTFCAQKFFRCKHCGNLIGMLHDSGQPIVCCGEPMQELIANTSDGATEKHVPVVTVDGDAVHVIVGSVEHPMTDAHYIQWIYLKTEKGGQRKCLTSSDKPAASFKVTDDKPVAVYEYCNLHGLWVKEL